MTDEQKISFKQLVEARKEEMQHIRPGFMTEVTDGTHTMIVCSPEPREKSQFRVSND